MGGCLPLWITRYEKLFNSLDSGASDAPNPTLILTATDRLALVLNGQFSIYKGVEHASLHSQSVIFSFGAWLKGLWLQASAHVSERLLSVAQEQVLWERIIQANTGTLIASENAANLASEALNLVQSWELPWPFPVDCASENSALFEAWSRLFQKTCREQTWITVSELASYICAYFDKGILKYPTRIMLVGFDALNPSFQKLLSTLTKSGTQIEYFTELSVATSIYRFEAEDVGAEILIMAHWAKQALQNNPGGSLIGCIVPKLEQRRNEVLKTFNRVFSDQPTAFDLSAPCRLGEIPIVAIALKLFELGEACIDLQTLGLLLRTPFIGASSQERFARAQLDVHLRSFRTQTLSVETILGLAAEEGQSFYCPIWRDQVVNFRSQLIADKLGVCLPSVWAGKILDYLNVLGWPGERPVNSDQKEVIEAFEKMLTTFSTLDVVCKTMHWNQALLRLARMASQTFFQSLPMWPFAPIQILGSLEAIGCVFTQVWVLGLTDETWPQPPQLNPLIPSELQSKFDIPHASAARELNFSHRITEQFCSLAPKVIFSSASYDGDVQQQPSRLINVFPTISLTELDLEALSIAEKKFQRDNCEYFVDVSAPKVVLGERIRGGVSLFKLQAACPFRAFAEIRLQAKALNRIRSHIDRKEQGSLVHHVLELIWKTLKNQATLLSYSTENLHQLVENKVDDAINQLYVGQSNLLNNGFNRIERKRLIQLLLCWLELQEKPRPAFNVVALESEAQIEFANLALKVRIDRIDEVEEIGKKLLIDYKTGSVAREDWFGERLNEPQLPLYCVSSGVPMSGVLFAQMKAGELLFKGIAEEGIEIQGVQCVSVKTWSDQNVLWRSQLENLALQFSKGDARVDPKEGAETCRFCELKMLCRVNDFK
jgi:ATP-dependent helicase/nuclease subunit B